MVIHLLPGPLEGDDTCALDLLQRRIWVKLAAREDAMDLTAYPGGWWEGVIVGVQPFVGHGPLFEFHFVDDDGDEWLVEVALRAEDYDPYLDPMSEPADYAWYLLED